MHYSFSNANFSNKFWCFSWVDMSATQLYLYTFYTHFLQFCTFLTASTLYGHFLFSAPTVDIFCSANFMMSFILSQFQKYFWQSFCLPSSQSLFIQQSLKSIGKRKDLNWGLNILITEPSISNICRVLSGNQCFHGNTRIHNTKDFHSCGMLCIS